MARIGSRLAGKLLESGRLPRSWHPVTSATPAASGPVQTSVTGGPKLAFQVVQGVEKVGEDEEFAWPGATFGGFGDAEEACLCPASSSQAGFCMLKTSASTGDSCNSCPRSGGFVVFPGPIGIPACGSPRTCPTVAI